MCIDAHIDAHTHTVHMHKREICMQLSLCVDNL